MQREKRSGLFYVMRGMDIANGAMLQRFGKGFESTIRVNEMFSVVWVVGFRRIDVALNEAVEDGYGKRESTGDGSNFHDDRKDCAPYLKSICLSNVYGLGLLGCS